MAFSRISLRLILGLIPLFLFPGCGDLEPEMQDTRSVVLKMNFNQRSSSRSSQISQAEVSNHKTHLILALPAWENLSSSYRNYYSSFAQELMNPLDNKVSLDIPLNTQMKIFAFLFQQDYTKPQLLSGAREVGYYGESQPFSIGKNTNNLKLNINLQSAGTDDGDNGYGNDNGDTNGDEDLENEGGNDTTAQLTDIVGNVYKTVVIGDQHWMAENLKVTKYRNGDNITHILKNSTVSFAWNNNTDGAYGYYNDIAANRDTYGMLYNWYALDNSTGRYICPQGWHVPTDSEFSDLVDELGSDPGAKLKEKGTVHWSSDPGTSNSSEFTALPAGNRIAYSGFDYNLGTRAFFWTSSSTGSTAKYLYLRDDNSSIFSGGSSSKNSGFSIRCLED